MNTGSIYKNVYLALGSNTGDLKANLRRGKNLLEKGNHVTIIRSSSIFKNPPLLYLDQPDFLNQVLEIETSLDPRELLPHLKAIEKIVGRIARFRNGPREIDLDILSFGNLKINTQELIIPHPGLFVRPYLRDLLADIGETPQSITDFARPEYFKQKVSG